MDILKGLHKEFYWFIWAMVGFGIIWFFTGGYENQSSRGSYIRPLAPLDSGEVYGNEINPEFNNKKETLNLPEGPGNAVKSVTTTIKNAFIKTEEIRKTTITTGLSGDLTFDGIAGAKGTTPDTEYVRLRSEASIITIPSVVDVLILGTTYTKKPAELTTGDRLLITSGRSPVGTSFRVNICSGYLGQFQTYTPELRKDCPLPSQEFARSGIRDEACREFVDVLPRCSTFEGVFPKNISETCKAFVAEKLSYNGCVFAHKNDTNFLTNEWRIYLGQTKELWSNTGNSIRLVDTKENTVSTLSY